MNYILAAILITCLVILTIVVCMEIYSIIVSPQAPLPSQFLQPAQPLYVSLPQAIVNQPAASVPGMVQSAIITATVAPSIANGTSTQTITTPNSLYTPGMSSNPLNKV